MSRARRQNVRNALTQDAENVPTRDTSSTYVDIQLKELKENEIRLRERMSRCADVGSDTIIRAQTL